MYNRLFVAMLCIEACICINVNIMAIGGEERGNHFEVPCVSTCVVMDPSEPVMNNKLSLSECSS